MIPFLFIDVKDGAEKPKGTSYVNLLEVEILCKFTKYVIQQFGESEMLTKELGFPP